VAEEIGGEIVGCDALQVYRGFDVGTAKPGPEDRRRVRHHLIDVVDPRSDYDLGAYVRDAEAAVAQVAASGKVPLIVGGTGMYLRGLLRGVMDAPGRNPLLRRRLHAVARRRGPAALHAMLRRRDPASADRVPPGDVQRVVRALEWAASGAGTWSEGLSRVGRWAAERERYDAVKVILDMPREELAGRLDARVDGFFAAGLSAEVAGLLEAGVPPAANAFLAIGYREVLAAILDGRPPESVVDVVRRNTRRYAKRQRTWFRREPGAVWLDASRDDEETVARIVSLWTVA
jgi:tRNA dimethylallyltransferase